jgi:phosphodiesterase/alkaline phosphatase D-like protein
MPTRRELLGSAAALSVAACGPDGTLRPRPGGTQPPPTGDTGAPPLPDTGTPPDTGGPEPTTEPVGPGPEPIVPWDPPGDIDDELFAFGVQTGDPLPGGVLVSVRQHGEGTIDLALAIGTETGWQEIPIADVVGLPADEGVVQVELTGLLPDHAYSVVAYTAGRARRSISARFRTAIAPDASRIIRFGATSCLGSLGAPWRSLSRVAEDPVKLDFFLLLGDTIYADEGLSPAGDWEGHWDTALATDGLRDISSAASLVATWDDHEVDNDFLVWEQPDEVAAGLIAFQRAIPQRPGPSRLMWRKLSWGTALDVFVMDCRGERSPGAYVSDAQRDWLEQELLASQARFKVIVNSVPITDMDDILFGIANSDGWMDYPADRARILEHITDNGITGVLWISGDVHWGAIATVDPPGGAHAGQIEVICGPAGSFLNPVWVAADPPHYEAAVGQWNTVVFELDPSTGVARVVFEGDSGRILERQTVL